MSDNVTAPDSTATPAPATSAPSAAPAPATPSAATPAPATSGAPQAPATGAPGEGWVPSYRLREANERAQRDYESRLANERASWQQQWEQAQQQIRALVGVQPPANPEVAAVRNQFGQLYPGLARLEEQADRLLALQERAGDLETQNNHYWQSYGRQTMDRLFDVAEKSLGAPLTEEGKRSLHSSFVGFVQSSPELTARYAQDPSLANEWWQSFSSNFIDPVRRASQATVAGRAAVVAGLPQDSPGSGIPPTAAPPKPAGLDERAAQGWALYQQSKK